EPVAEFQDAVNLYNLTPNPGNAAEVQAAGTQLLEQLGNISGKALSAEADAGFAVGIPHPKYGMSAYVKSNVVGGAVGEVSADDIAAIQQAMDDAQSPQLTVDPTDALTSSLRARFSRVTEVGLAIAREFDVLGGLSVGITPKIIGVRTYDFLFIGSE